jgi:hypothetical protein
MLENPLLFESSPFDAAFFPFQMRKHPGGGQLGAKSLARIAKFEKAKAKEKMIVA